MVKTTTTLLLSQVDVTTPSSDEAVAMGARDWPQRTRTGTWSESFVTGQRATRYVLEGSGALVATTYDDEGEKEAMVMAEGSETRRRVGPGTLVEVTGRADLYWDVDKEMIVLTPGYEEGGLLLAVGALLVVLCGALIAGAGG